MFRTDACFATAKTYIDGMALSKTGAAQVEKLS